MRPPPSDTEATRESQQKACRGPWLDATLEAASPTWTPALVAGPGALAVQSVSRGDVTDSVRTFRVRPRLPLSCQRRKSYFLPLRSVSCPVVVGLPSTAMAWDLVEPSGMPA